jgi:hypothetical protein
MTSFRTNIAVIAASAIALATATPAFAKSDNDARAAAINACRTAVATALQTEPANVRVERIRTGGRTVDLRFEAREDGARIGVADCTFARAAATTTVAVIEPATQTASATATPAQ